MSGHCIAKCYKSVVNAGFPLEGFIDEEGMLL